MLFRSVAFLPPAAPSAPGGLSNPCDVNGDGVVNQADVNLAVQAALKTGACTADLRHNGTCDVVDVQRIINYMNTGGSCRVGQ